MNISVIIPVYKVEKYLRRCLDSIVNQNLPEFEIICIDDASPDRCGEIVREYQSKYSNIRLLQNHKNIGLSSSRNRGLDEANGKYVMFVDSDDYIRKDTLRILYNRMERDKLDVLYFNKRYIFDANWPFTHKQNYNRRFGENETLSGKEMFTKFHLADSFKSMNAYTQFFRRKFLVENKLRFYDGIVHEDFLFYFLCAMKAERTGNFDRVFYYYCKRTSSITCEITKIRKQSIFVTLSEILKYWKNHDFTDDENKAIEKFCTVVYRNCITCKKEGNFCDSLQFSDVVDKFIYRNIMNSEYVFITNKEWEKIKNQNNIWIYGAGNVAHELVEILERKKVRVRGVLVTNQGENNCMFYGWNIWSIDKAPLDKNEMIIVAATGRYKREMVKKLREMRFHNIIIAAKRTE